MIGVRLHGPRDLRAEEIPDPAPPGPGEVLVRITAAGICGSDLHAYAHGRIGDTQVIAPLVLGHECAGVIELCGADAVGGDGEALAPGSRVALDPATSCGTCEQCLRGNPHLCTSLHFLGLSPDDGCFRERLIAPARSCFRLPDELDNASGALLEPLGVALHAVALSGAKRGDSLAVFGAGPIGLLIVQAARLAGADPIFVAEPLPWRLALAERYGGIPLRSPDLDPVGAMLRETRGRGVDVAIEAAWADATIQQAADAAVPGGKVVLVGIPADDRCSLRHSTARRKELTLLFSRRMKDTYPSAIALVRQNLIETRSLISHRCSLRTLPAAVAMNAAYADNVVKVIVEPEQAISPA